MKKAYLNYFLDAVIGLAFLVAALSGVAFIFMGSGGYQGGHNAVFLTAFLGIARTTWSDLHLLSGLVMIAGVGMHLVLHWQWIVGITKKMLSELPRRKAETCEVLA